MPHIHRFYVPSGSPTESEVVLRDEEAHHALHVVRIRVGDTAEVFDGCGRSWTGAVVAKTQREVTIALTSVRTAPRPPIRLTLLQAWLHRDKPIEDLIRRCTELGVTRFVFFPAVHSERLPKTTDKWQRLAVESCKQCGRLWLPEFSVAATLDEALSQAEGSLLIATKSGPPVSLADQDLRPAASLLTGPEGDFTGDEVERALVCGAVPISLGENTLRSELAAIVGCTLIRYEQGELGPRPA